MKKNKDDPQGKIRSAERTEKKSFAEKTASRILNHATSDMPSAETMEIFRRWPAPKTTEDEKIFPLGYMGDKRPKLNER